MAKKTTLQKSKKSLISQILIGGTLIVVLVAAYEAIVQNDVTGLAPTQLFLVAGFLGILGIYLKDEK